jgi:CO/xanthine dehydrogenase Mo-binding subunit
MKKPFQQRVRREHVGGYRPRIDALEKATGRATYADDLASRLRLPGMLYAKVLRSPHAHARIKSLDTSAAARLPGVVGILTCRDPEVAALKPTSAGWTDGVDTVPYDRMMWGRFKDRRVLGDYAVWVGDEVGVAVAAETEALAEEALRLVKVEWEVLPFVLEAQEAMKPGAPVLHPEIAPRNVLPPDPVGGPDVFVDKGNVADALAAAEVVVECSATYHNATQNSLDPWCCVIEWQDDRVTIWSNSYEADQSRIHISTMLDVPVNKVRVVSHYVGGQFGRGDTGDQPFFLFTALLAKRTGRPVKFKHTRRESFHDGRQQATYTAQVGATRDGRITAMSFKSIGNAGAHADHTMFALKFAPKELCEVALAHIPNLRFEAYGVYTNKMPACMMRGVGNSQLNLILGLIVDVLAEKVGLDPIDVCIRNFGHEWETLPDKSLQAVLLAGAEGIGWKEKRHVPGQGPTFEGVKRRGVGFSYHPGWHAEWQEERRGEVQVGITLNADGSVTLDAPTVETGTGSNTCNVLGCAEALKFLGIGPADIHWVKVVDTDVSSKDCVQTDSAVSYLQSEVMAVAALELKTKLIEKLAPRLARAPAEVDIADGRIFPKTARQGDERPRAARRRRPGAAHGEALARAAGQAHRRAGHRQLRRGGGGHGHRAGAGAEARRGERLRVCHVRLGCRGPADRRAGDRRRGNPDRGDHLRPADRRAAQLQLDRLQDPDDGRHARHRPRAARGVARRGRVRRLRHRRGDPHVHAAGDPQRRLQRHRGAHR